MKKPIDNEAAIENAAALSPEDVQDQIAAGCVTDNQTVRSVDDSSVENAVEALDDDAVDIAAGCITDNPFVV